MLQLTELGNQLKEARLAQGLSLDDVQTMTKIQKRYLIGIEEGNYSSMPGNFYVRAFIKQYAEALNLNPDEIFETYKSEIPASYNEDLPQQLSRVKTHKELTDGNSKIFNILPKVLIAVFVLGVASLLYYYIAKNTGSDAKNSVSKDSQQVKIEKSTSLEKLPADQVEKNQQNNTKEDVTKQAEQKPPVVETPKQELTVVQSKGTSSTYELKNADKFVVKLVSKGNTWVSIKNGKGKTFFAGSLKIGATESYTQDLSTESMAVLRLGNAADTEIYVNDQKLEYAIPATANVQNITIQYVLKTQ